MLFYPLKISYSGIPKLFLVSTEDNHRKVFWDIQIHSTLSASFLRPLLYLNISSAAWFTKISLSLVIQLKFNCSMSYNNTCHILLRFFAYIKYITKKPTSSLYVIFVMLLAPTFAYRHLFFSLLCSGIASFCAICQHSVRKNTRLHYLVQGGVKMCCK